ncbi:MAG: leucine-rich repeat protein [Eggerthellaceae bacterium]|nr:leucine-rich repeat protein [Eggerthellaceae bacterium]
MNEFEIVDGVLIGYHGDGDTVVIPEGVTEIRWSAFDERDYIGELIIPKSLVEITGGYWWRGSIQRIECPDFKTWVRIEGKDSMLSNLKGELVIGDWRIRDTLVIPETLSVVPEWAFAGFELLEAIEFPASLTTIEAHAFNGCSGLKRISFAPESGDISIGSDAFKSVGICTVEAPSISWWAHMCKGGLENGGYTLRVSKNAVTSLDACLPSDIAEIVACEKALSGCLSLKALNLPDGVSAIGQSAFENCKNLSSVVLPATLRTLSERAFFGCTSLREIAIPEGVETIPRCCFTGCSALSNVKLPQSLVQVDSYAFSSCGSLGKIDFPSHLRTISGGAFVDCPINPIILPDSIRRVSFNDGNWKGNFSVEGRTVLVSLPVSFDFVPEFCKKLTTDSTLIIRDHSFDSDAQPTPIRSPFTMPALRGHMLAVYENTDPEKKYAHEDKWVALVNRSKQKFLPEASTSLPVLNYLVNNKLLDTVEAQTIMDTPGIGAEAKALIRQYMKSIPDASDSEDKGGGGTAEKDKGGKAKEKDPLLEEWVVGKYSSESDMITSWKGNSLAVSTPPSISGKEIHRLGSEVFAPSGKKNKEARLHLLSVTVTGKVEEVGSRAFWGCKELEEISLPGSVRRIGADAFDGCSSLYLIFAPGVVPRIIPEAVRPAAANGFIRLAVSNCLPEDAKVGEWSAWIKENAAKMKPFFVNDGVFAWLLANGFVKERSRPAPLEADLVFVPHEYGFKVVGFKKSRKLPPASCLTVPGEYNGAQVFSVDRSWEHSPGMNGVPFEKLMISEGVEVLEDSAFAGCNSLREVVLPTSMKKLGKRSFAGCKKLRVISIPEGIVEIAPDAFEGCDSLDVNGTAIPAIIARKGTYTPGLRGKAGKTEIGPFEFEPAASVAGGMGLVKYSGDDTDVVIPDEVGGKPVVELRDKVFMGNKTMKSAVLPRQLHSIGKYAFKSCEQLSNITFNESLVEIGQEAFANCNCLESAILPGSLKTVGYQAFCRCIALRRVVIPGSVKAIDNYAFQYCRNLESVSIASGVKEIGANAFGGCTSLGKDGPVTIPASVRKLGDSVFDGCYNLVSDEERAVRAKERLNSWGGYAQTRPVKIVAENPEITRAFDECDHDLALAFEPETDPAALPEWLQLPAVRGFILLGFAGQLPKSNELDAYRDFIKGHFSIIENALEYKNGLSSDELDRVTGDVYGFFGLEYVFDIGRPRPDFANLSKAKALLWLADIGAIPDERTSDIAVYAAEQGATELAAKLLSQSGPEAIGVDLLEL